MVRSTSRWAAAMLAVMALSLPAAGAIRDKGEIAREIVALLQAFRQQEGLTKLEEREALAEAARKRARTIARRAPELRLSQEEPIETILQQAGVRRYHRAREHVEMQQGYGDAARAAISRWKESPGTWSIMMDPRADALGLATVVGEDGWLVLAAIVLEDLEVPPDLGAWEVRLLELINQVREEHGAPPLSSAAPLARVARWHSEDMARRGYFAHETPDGRDLSHRIQGLGLEYQRLAENIGRNRGAEDPVAQAVQGWMNSSAHRANILAVDFIETGIGISVDEEGMFYFTQVFLQHMER